jgi:Putative SAM-dependent methyltransferase
MRMRHVMIAVLRQSSLRLFSTNPVIPVLTTEVQYCNELGLQMTSDIDATDGLILRTSSSGVLELVAGGLSVYKKEKPFCIDFSSVAMQRRGAAADSELLVKAMGKSPRRETLLWDLTAGLGRDSFLLASAGFRVCVCVCVLDK